MQWLVMGGGWSSATQWQPLVGGMGDLGLRMWGMDVPLVRIVAAVCVGWEAVCEARVAVGSTGVCNSA